MVSIPGLNLFNGKGSKKFLKNAEKFAFGTKDKIKQGKLLTPEQEELMTLIQQGLTSGEGPFGEAFGKFNEADFEKGVAQPALKNFQENILPDIQEKFIRNNQVLSSGNQNAQAKAGADLQSKLAELMYGAKQTQKQNQIQGLQTSLSTKGYENFYKQGEQGAVQGLIQGLAKGAGQAGGAAIAG